MIQRERAEAIGPKGWVGRRGDKDDDVESERRDG